MWVVTRRPCGSSFDLAQPPGLRHRLGRDVAHRDIAAFGDELTRQLAPHARAASGDDGNLSGKILHGDRLTFLAMLSFRRFDAFSTQRAKPFECGALASFHPIVRPFLTGRIEPSAPGMMLPR